MTAEPLTMPQERLVADPPAAQPVNLVLLPGLDVGGVRELNLRCRQLPVEPAFTEFFPIRTSVWVAKVEAGAWRSVVAELGQVAWLDPDDVFLWVQPYDAFPRVYRADVAWPETWLVSPLGRSASEAPA